jgi:glycosyltransferase involved in cell wall biosynthesis
MRIALITAHSPLSPASAHPAALARALARNGHRVTLYARAEDSAAPRTAILGGGVSVEHVKAGPARPLTDEQAACHMPEVAAYLAGRWRTRPPAVVHAFSWTAGLAALGAVRGTDIPVVQSFGSLGSMLRRQTGADISAARIKLEASIGRTASAVLASSEDEAADLGRLAVPRKLVRVIPHGVDTQLFSPDGDRASRGSRARLITFADEQARGLQTVIRALAQLPEAELVVVGGPDARHLPRSGPFREAAQLAAGLRPRNRVTFAGQVPDAELPALLRSADLLVSATPYDPAGIAAIQAMGCGLTAVVSAVGGQRDAVIDGITGLHVVPGQPAMLAHRLRALLARPALRLAYGIAAADRVRSRYCVDRVAEETAAVYQHCIAARTAALAPARTELADQDETADLGEVAAFG